MARFAVLSLLLLTVTGVSGPRLSTEYQWKEIRLPDDLDGYLAAAEGRLADLRPGSAREIVWAHADRRRTEISLVYLHGFSANRREVAPLADRVANAFGANLYYARLTGHGRSAQAMAEASLQAWLDDAREAMAIGRRIGRQVVVLATSTGGTLATWLSSQHEVAPPLATVLISPNFGPRQWAAELLTWPWVAHLLPLFQDTYSWMPHNPDHGRHWTTSFPVEALFPMAASVALVRQVDPAALRAPFLVFYSPDDKVVDSRRITRFFQDLAVRPKALVRVDNAGDPDNHVLAGDILSPRATDCMTARIVAFVNEALGVERRGSQGRAHTLGLHAGEVQP